MVESYRDLVAWQKAMKWVADVYRATLELPDTERFALVSQPRRAAVSASSALAEGHSRSTTREFVRYIAIAMGSLAEVETQLMICPELKLLQGERVRTLPGACDEQNRVLRGLKKWLASRIKSAPSSLAPRLSPL